MNISTFTKGTIPLTDLPKWSPWPARILGLSDWSVPNRTVEKVDKEYDKDKYLECLIYAKEQNSTDADTVKAFEFHLEKLTSICVSHEEKLYEMSADQIMPANDALLIESISPLIEEVDTIVEIGCGYGYNLWQLNKHFPNKIYRGGEYSPNAVQLAAMLYKDHDNISVEECNFYDNSYAVLEQCKPNEKVLLITRHAIEQLPTVAPFLQTLTQYFDRLSAVCHLELVYQNYDNTLLGMLRQRYATVNDYNNDLLTLLEDRPDIAIKTNNPDVFGHNPLNSTSLLTWQPV